MCLALETPVGQLVTENPGRAKLFESFGIDYCCGGKLPLAQACERKNLDAQVVLNVLRAFDEQSSKQAPERDWSSASLTELADHIEQTHHAYMKSQLPRLDANLRKIAARHGPGNPKLVKLLEVFLELRAEYEQHELKEERILFPLIRRMDAGDIHAAAHCESITNPIRVMIMEHDHAGDALRRMRELTDGYTTPANACNTYRGTMHELAELEHDLHRHVHKENSILFPRAAELEASAAA